MVSITPIISRSVSGVVVPELGAGGGGRDLQLQVLDIELDDGDKISELMKVCSEMIDDHELRKKFLQYLDHARQKDQLVTLPGMVKGGHEVSLVELVQYVAKLSDQCGDVTIERKLSTAPALKKQGSVSPVETVLPRSIVRV